ncbi:MAG: nitrite/sulfite reductase [Deltaproteobacteria bacterium]|nr:MAG: nitrite/sulfite reductase [Deltaproteobacteria bacterium]
MLVDEAEIDAFETTLARHRAGQVSEKVFTEYRLRFGTYGQRQEGVQMQRIKLPLGRVTPEQLETLADLADHYADSVLHVTTRQDVQLHFVALDDVPALLRRLARVGITTREACGNAVRNVTACARAGVCPGEAFDTGGLAYAIARYLLRHPDTQDFGRKFKISVSGCADGACGLARIHDIGLVAKLREGARGYAVYVGGGLGAVPRQAECLYPWLPEEQILPLAQAVARVFARLGEKRIRSRARMKFLVQRLGLDGFRAEVEAERRRLPEDPRWSALLAAAKAEMAETPGAPGTPLDPAAAGGDFGRFLVHNCRRQRPHPDGEYWTAKVLLPLGDLTAGQARALARIAREHGGARIRLTADQNVVLRWVPGGALPALHAALAEADLARWGADTARNVSACPGTDTCKLGIASSRGLAATLDAAFQDGLAATGARTDLSIKISGCPNSCGQHHLAHIGFSGSSKRRGDHVAPVFQVFLGGDTRHNGARYGLPVGKVAARRAPEVVAHLERLYLRERREGEAFPDTMERLGKKRIAAELAEYMRIPSYEEAPEYYRDNRQSFDYVRSVGVGECAGEVVAAAEFMLEEAERRVFEAGVALEEGDAPSCAAHSLEAMRAAADALLSTRGLLKSDGYDTLAEFRRHFVEGDGAFHAGTAHYLEKAAKEGEQVTDLARLRVRVEEASLFVDEANVVYARLLGAQVK